MEVSFKFDLSFGWQQLRKLGYLTSFLGEELEYVGGLGGSRFGFGGAVRKTSVSSNHTQGAGSEIDDNEEMEMN